MINLVLIYLLLSSFDSQVPYDHQWTKAICEDNICRDYLITCLEGKEIERVPISGFAVFDKDFTYENDRTC